MKIARISAYRVELPLQETTYKWSGGKSVTVVADNYAITKDTVTYMCEQAKKAGGKHKALILIGDLSDINAVGWVPWRDLSALTAFAGLVLLAMAASEWVKA